MLWPFKTRVVVEPCFPIGQYVIDTKIDGLQGLAPLSAAELVALNTAVQFQDEQIWHAPDADFMGLKWDTILGTVGGAIYKIAIQWTGPRHHVGKTYRDILIYCTKYYGKSKKGMLWDTSDGNIVVDSTNIGDKGVLNVFVTTRRVRQFKRI